MHQLYKMYWIVSKYSKWLLIFVTLFLLILFLEVASGKVPNNFACSNITRKSVFWGVLKYFVAIIFWTAYPSRWQHTVILQNAMSTHPVTQHSIPQEFNPPPQQQCCENLKSQSISFSALPSNSFLVYPHVLWNQCNFSWNPNVENTRTHNFTCSLCVRFLSPQGKHTGWECLRRTM